MFPKPPRKYVTSASCSRGSALRGCKQLNGAGPPQGYQTLCFASFLREDGKSTMEHIRRFTEQCGMAMGRVLQCPSPYPHFKKLPVPVPVPSWETTLVSFPISYGYLSVHTRTHYPHFNYEKTIKTSQLK
ncbi:hypothetical protein MTR_4g060630 [Medicago truncatula]|uniref:Uncharacterized protein n=1 Tax=Medicago truncatula TaxID=3880 RepID=G7JQH2_MEDTR|nr:hypothetical protein MTR_4g060630 [Medicago truncatula]